MSVSPLFPPILLFGPRAAILPSRPISAAPARAATVKGGAAGAPQRFTLDHSEHAGSAFPVSGMAAVWLTEEIPMPLLTLVATCGLAARAALFVPLGRAPVCTSPASQVRGKGEEAVAPWQADIAAAAQRFHLPQAWIAAVMRAESGGKATADGKPLRSPAGAIGLMQVMPQTYAALRTRYQLGADPALPRDSILAGAAYLRQMLDRYGVPWFLAAYNAGPARLDAFLHAGRPLPAETERYLAALVPQLGLPSGVAQAVAGATASSTKSALRAAFEGPKDVVSAGLFVTNTAYAKAVPAPTALPIVGPNGVPMPAPTELAGALAAARFAPRFVSASALAARENGALFVAPP